MTQISNDTELWRACRDGERDAFRRVVERYQGLVTSITYNATGDIPVSEDLAQDTFLRAWRKIGTLKEPEKLAAWLCAIARNRVRDWMRRKRTDVDRQAVALVDAAHPALTEPGPDEHMEQEDESALVWRAIESIPADYREVLVLHYREQADTAQISEALGISEATVRQRLSRARSKVRREVAAVVERGLRRTRPSHAFTVAVMAALPAMTPKVATAAVGGGIAAKSSASLFSFGLFIGPIIGLLGGLFGTWVGIKQADSVAERRFVIRYALVIWSLILLFMLTFGLMPLWLPRHLGGSGFMLVLSGLWLVYLGLLVPIIIWGNRRRRAIRREQRSPDLTACVAHAKLSPAAIYGGLCGAVLGSMSWMVAFALGAGDSAVAVLVMGIAIGLCVLCVASLKRRGPEAVVNVMYTLVAVIGAVTAVVVNTRLHAWLAHFSDRPVAEMRTNLPFWAINVFLITIFLVTVIPIRLSQHKDRGRVSNQPD